MQLGHFRRQPGMVLVAQGVLPVHSDIPALWPGIQLPPVLLSPATCLGHHPLPGAVCWEHTKSLDHLRPTGMGFANHMNSSSWPGHSQLPLQTHWPSHREATTCRPYPHWHGKAILCHEASCSVCRGDLDCSTRSTERFGQLDATCWSPIEMAGQALGCPLRPLRPPLSGDGEASVHQQVLRKTESHAALR